MKNLLSPPFVEYFSFHFPETFKRFQDQYIWSFKNDLGWEIEHLTVQDENFLNDISEEFQIDLKHETLY